MFAPYKKIPCCALPVFCLILTSYSSNAQVLIKSRLGMAGIPVRSIADQRTNESQTAISDPETTTASNEKMFAIPDSKVFPGHCRAPAPPLRVVEALEPKYENGTLKEGNYKPATKHGGQWYKTNTTIFVGCISGYTPIYNGLLTSTCMQLGKSEDVTWNGTFPECEFTTCWWLGDLSNVEFRFNGELLHRIENGFPDGTELKYLNWTCPSGYLADTASRYCRFDGHWIGSQPRCIETTTTTLTTPTELTTDISEAATQDVINNFIDPVKDEPTSTNAMLIWAVLMTSICIALLVSLVLIIRYGKCFSKKNREHQERYSYEHRPLNQAENIYGEIHSSTREDLGYMSIDQSTYELDSRRSNTYEDIETTEVSTPPISRPIIYAVPVPKPRRTAPSTESIVNNQQVDLQVPQDVSR